MLLKRFNREGLLACLPGVIARVAVAALLLWYAGAFTLLRGITPIEAVPVDALEGRYVSMDVDYIYDWFIATSSSNNDGSNEKIVDRSYVTTFDNDTYAIGFLVKGTKAIARADALLDASDAYYYYKTTDTPPSDVIKIRGIARPMTGQELTYYKEVLGYDNYEFSEAEKATHLPLVVDSTVTTADGRCDKSMAICLCIVAVVLFGSAVYTVIMALTGAWHTSVRRWAISTGREEEAQEQLAALMAETPGGHYCFWADNDVLLFHRPRQSFAANLSDVLWVYQITTQHRTNGIPTGKSHAIAIGTADGTITQIHLRKHGEKHVKAAMEYLHSALPFHVVFGWTQQLAQLFQNDRPGFAHLREANAAARERQAHTQMETAQYTPPADSGLQVLDGGKRAEPPHAPTEDEDS